MKCELARLSIAICDYGDLPDDERHALEQHLAGCPGCRDELEAVRALQRAMSLAVFQEPSANLLAQTRLKLEEALDSMPPAGWIMRARQSILRGLAILSQAPIAASTLLLLGV